MTEMVSNVSLDGILLGLLVVAAVLVLARSLRMPAGFTRNEERRVELRRKLLEQEFAALDPEEAAEGGETPAGDDSDKG